MDIKPSHRWFTIRPGILILFIYLASCHAPQRMTETHSLENDLLSDTLFTSAFSGFVLYDPATDRLLANIGGTKLYTPASNTKIATLLTGLEMLGDSLPVLGWATRNDTLFFRGTGNPLTLNPLVSNDTHLIDWLTMAPEKVLAYVPSQDEWSVFGPGWAWDDYLYDYQAEISDLPLYGNLLHIGFVDGTFSLTPGFFSDVSVEPSVSMDWHRSLLKNDFRIRFDTSETALAVPFHTSDSLLTEWLSLLSGRSIAIARPDLYEWTTVNSSLPDSLYIRLMHDSDNFIAEQILLMAAWNRGQNFDRAKLISEKLSDWGPEMKDKVRWVDGSGLSRYNLFSPYSFVRLLDRIYKSQSYEWICSVFPQGGVDGTIGNWYFPYVHAKTGSLSNNHNLSGFIEVKSGKVLIFSFMHNHFLDSQSIYKKWMENKLEWIHLNY